MWNEPLSRRVLGLGVLSGLAARAASRLGAQEPASGAGGQVSDAGRWDRVFERAEPVYETDANAFLVRCAERMQRERLLPGRAALDLAMGDGRNALFLAERGLEVTGLDISPVALEKARARAAERKLALQALEQDLFAYDYGAERWDLITVVYFNPAVTIFDRLQAATRPGGVIVIEGQGSEHQGEGPPPATRFRPNQLLEVFRGWRVLAYEDGLFECDWALGPPTHVVRMMARKPGAAK